MSPVLKKYLCWPALVLLLPSLWLFSQANPEKIEARLSQTNGKEKISLLTKLTDIYSKEKKKSTKST